MDAILSIDRTQWRIVGILIARLLSDRLILRYFSQLISHSQEKLQDRGWRLERAMGQMGDQNHRPSP